MPNICLVWDFDGTLTPDDSTSIVIDTIDPHRGASEFWTFIKTLRGDSRKPKWEHILAMDAPIWMYALSRISARARIPLNSEFFQQFVAHKIVLYPHVQECLSALKALETSDDFVAVGLNIRNFIISAGLQDLIRLVLSPEVVTYTFGCRYTVISDPDHPDEPESIPAFCMDETTKTRSLFEISKGSFWREDRRVNSRVEDKDLFAPFSNFVYIGDGFTDIPALSLVRSKGGLGVVVFNPDKDRREVDRSLLRMRMDMRADCITCADFSLSGDLYAYLRARCEHILQRYKAEGLSS